MFREMRRTKQQLPESEAMAILDSGSHGVLALLGDEGYPYAVPLSYAREGSALYFHCAREGHKLDAVRRCDRASFCVVAQDEVVPEDYSTRYRSVIVFGRISEVTEEAELVRAAELIGRRYSPGESEERLSAEIDSHMPALCALRLDIERMTGKESKALAQERRDKRAD